MDSLIITTVTIKSKLLLLMANYSKNWKNKSSLRLYCNAMEGNWNLEKQEGVEKIVEKLEKSEREVREKIDEDSMLKSKITQDYCLFLWPIKRLESHLLCRREFQE